MMRRDDPCGLEHADDAFDVVRREPAAGDPAQEQIDPAIVDLFLDQIAGCDTGATRRARRSRSESRVTYGAIHTTMPW